jgi:hypothetical protein
MYQGISRRTFCTKNVSLGARVNNTHIALHHIDKLGKFVKTSAPKKATDGSDALVVALRVPGARSVQFLQIHGTEFQHPEAAAIQTYAFLNK